MKAFLFNVFACVLALWLSGCASYARRSQSVRASFESGNYPVAINELQKLVARNDNDQLLYLMDLGLVQHTAGNYADAIVTFLKADKLAEIKDYTSISQEAASVMLSDEVKPYKGEDFEKILINVYLAIDFTLTRQFESALVECRKVNHKLDMMISQGQLPYERNAFAKYLSASLFEARGETNDAFVDYRQLLRWNSSTPYLGIPLLRLADKLRASQEFQDYKKQYPLVGDYKLAKNQGELILILEQGRSPVKVPSPAFRLLPTFRKRPYASEYAILRSDEGPKEARTETLFDIETTAIRELDHRIGLIVAKKLGGYVVKEVVADQVGKATKSPLAGALAGFLLHATDTADLRSWTTLPARLQIARLPISGGKHTVSADLVTSMGARTPNARQWAVDVKPGEVYFLDLRTTN